MMMMEGGIDRGDGGGTMGGIDRVTLIPARRSFPNPDNLIICPIRFVSSSLRELSRTCHRLVLHVVNISA